MWQSTRVPLQSNGCQVTLHNPEIISVSIMNPNPTPTMTTIPIRNKIASKSHCSKLAGNLFDNKGKETKLTYFI